MARFSLSFVEAGANQYPSNRVNTRRQRYASPPMTAPRRSITLSQFIERFGL